MLEKVKARLEKEICKVIDKEDLSIADYVFLQKVAEDTRLSALHELMLGGTKCHCQDNKETSQA